jgi:hypothetical protein
VLDQRDWYVLDKFSTDPVSGTDVVAATTGRWKRQIAASSGVAPVAQTFFVDGVNFSSSPTGTLSAPYRTIQQAIDQAVANLWTQVQIIVAPETYADPIAIPVDLEMVIIEGWGPTTFLLGTIISGNITYTSLPAGWGNLILRDVNITAGNITTTDPDTQDITIQMERVICGANITAANIQLSLLQTNQSADVTATGNLIVEFDGYSWQRHVLSAPTFSAVGSYMKGFNDAGHDKSVETATVNGVAIGTTVFLDFALPLVTVNDHISVTVVDQAARDFIVGGHCCTAGQATIWLTNLSRVSTNFDDDIEVLIHHQQIIQE